MPKKTREEIIVEAFWDDEGLTNYDDALRRIAERFMMTPAEVNKLIVEDDALNNGNT